MSELEQIIRSIVREEVSAQLAEHALGHVSEAGGDNLLTVRDVARLKQVATRTVYDWVARKVIRVSRTPGGSLRFRREDVDNARLDSV